MKVITIDVDTGKRVYTRKEVATLCGVSTQMVRIWEDKGYIPKSMRDENDYRYWDEDTLQEVLKYANMSVKDRHKLIKD